MPTSAPGIIKGNIILDIAYSTF